MARDDRIYEEAAALWRELYGDTPPRADDGRAVLDAIMRDLPALGYDRLRSPYLRPRDVVMPR